jgi:hypothetical protein
MHGIDLPDLPKQPEENNQENGLGSPLSGESTTTNCRASPSPVLSPSSLLPRPPLLLALLPHRRRRHRRLDRIFLASTPQEELLKLAGIAKHHTFFYSNSIRLGHLSTTSIRKLRDNRLLLHRFYRRRHAYAFIRPLKRAYPAARLGPDSGRKRLQSVAFLLPRS